ncbi:hypothetical protein G4O51_07125 [Candidatus Bathyarchaeota archaeon A05DMB-2]|nr:hypothetical protein [Candidatus Bathyarchaeota archaeon A05DMB-2]
MSVGKYNSINAKVLSNRRQNPLAKPTLTLKGRVLNCLGKIKPKNLTLTVRGFMICCTNETTAAVEQKFDWGNALIDAFITSGITFFSTLGGTAIAGDIDTLHILTSATVAALSQFFVFLALKRGLVKPQEAQHKHLC